MEGIGGFYEQLDAKKLHHTEVGNFIQTHKLMKLIDPRRNAKQIYKNEGN
jgi:hypothetical protein